VHDRLQLFQLSSFIFIAAKKGAVVGRLTFSGFDSVKKNLGWVKELNLIVKTKQKAEIQL
jgi:predicted N-acetyltransferase YhbS